MSAENANVLRSEISRLRSAVMELTSDPSIIYPTDAEAHRKRVLSQEDPEDGAKKEAAEAAEARAAQVAYTLLSRTLQNAPGPVQAFAAAQGERSFINPHARPTSALPTPTLFPTMDPVAMGLSGAQKHEWDVLYPSVSYLYDALCLALANITDESSLQAAVWMHDIYDLLTLRVDGLTLVVQKGAEIGNATMDAAIDPFANQLSNSAIKKAYLVVKDASTKASLRAAAARQSSQYSRQVENYKTGDYKGKPYTPQGQATAGGGGGGGGGGRPPYNRPSSGGGGGGASSSSSTGAAKST